MKFLENSSEPSDNCVQFLLGNRERYSSAHLTHPSSGGIGESCILTDPLLAHIVNRRPICRSCSTDRGVIFHANRFFLGSSVTELVICVCTSVSTMTEQLMLFQGKKYYLNVRT